MSKSACSLVIGSVLLSQTVAVGPGHAEPGRYQLIPNVQIPGAAGGLETRSVLLDSGSGQTWIMVPNDDGDSDSAMTWVPVAISFKGQAQRAPSQPAYQLTTQSADPSAAKADSDRRTLRLRFYDNDP